MNSELLSCPPQREWTCWLLQDLELPGPGAMSLPSSRLRLSSNTSPAPVVCQVGDKTKTRQGLHPPRTGHGKGFITYSFNQHFSSVSLAPGPGCWREGGEGDRCGPWPLRMHCQEEGMHKETVTNQLDEAGEVLDEALRLTS